MQQPPVFVLFLVFFGALALIIGSLVVGLGKPLGALLIAPGCVATLLGGGYFVLVEALRAQR